MASIVEKLRIILPNLERATKIVPPSRSTAYGYGDFAYLTGLRKQELASLTPASFRLEDDPPTVTLAAAYSKHRRKDVLPLHPELVSLLSGWLPQLKPTERLFPLLGTKKLGEMIRSDLKRAGIPYRTSEGFADFHAAGRHTYITQLLRSGASLPEARQLARHSDVKMTWHRGSGQGGWEPAIPSSIGHSRRGERAWGECRAANALQSRRRWESIAGND